MKKKFLPLLSVLLLTSCAKLPEGYKGVSDCSEFWNVRKTISNQFQSSYSEKVRQANPEELEGLYGETMLEFMPHVFTISHENNEDSATYKFDYDNLYFSYEINGDYKRHAPYKKAYFYYKEGVFTTYTQGDKVIRDNEEISSDEAKKRIAVAIENYNCEFRNIVFSPTEFDYRTYAYIDQKGLQPVMDVKQRIMGVKDNDCCYFKFIGNDTKEIADRVGVSRKYELEFKIEHNVVEFYNFVLTNNKTGSVEGKDTTHLEHTCEITYLE